MQPPSQEYGLIFRHTCYALWGLLVLKKIPFAVSLRSLPLTTPLLTTPSSPFRQGLWASGKKKRKFNDYFSCNPCPHPLV